jgi:hypothetical protein
MDVISLGVGRTGTFSQKLALERLGFEPCHHMLEVEANRSEQVPLWLAALSGIPDWGTIYKGYESVCGWPSAGFSRELIAEYPSAKVILSVRNPETWAESFSATTAKLVAERGQLFAEPQDWLEMLARAVQRAGFSPGLDMAGLQSAFTAHNEAVQAAVPANRLLIYKVTEGWGPLCNFLGVPVPPEPFPHRNDRREFWGIGALEK